MTSDERQAWAANTIATAIVYNAPADMQGSRMDSYALLWGRISAAALDEAGLLCALVEGRDA